MTGIPWNAQVDAFENALVRAGISLVAALRRRGIEPHQAEDLAQEACLRALERKERFEAGRPLLPWLLVVASRRHQDLVRRGHPRAASALPEVTGPEEVAALSEERRRLDAAMRTLSHRERDVLGLFYGKGVPVRGIAEVLGLTVSAVKTHLHRARATLAARMRDH